jgi:pimeloyl-ACP methyl ester carboxylesterase
LALGSAVYLDPAWRAQQPGMTEMFLSWKNWTRDDVAANNPDWNADQVAEKHTMLQRWDPETVDITRGFPGRAVTPSPVPALVLRADPSMTITDQHADQLQQAGYTVATVPGAGHVIYRDKYTETLAALDGWRARRDNAVAR